MEGPAVISASEYVWRHAPFTLRRVAGWQECDPAGVVYVGNYPSYLLSAARQFRAFVLGSGRDDSPVAPPGLPARSMSLAFMRSLWPGEAFDMAVHVGEIGSRTFDTYVLATLAADGAQVFAARLTSICIDRADRTRAVAMPAPLRERLEDYRGGAALPEGLEQVRRVTGAGA